MNPINGEVYINSVLRLLIWWSCSDEDSYRRELVALMFRITEVNLGISKELCSLISYEMT